MSNPEGIVWLASYPKSGNTWFRIVLSRVLNQSVCPDYINDIDTILGSPMVVNRMWMNRISGFDTALLSDDELDMLRPAAYEWYAGQVGKSVYIKIHDAYTFVDASTPLFPVKGCLGAVYFIRNPLDVAISLAHHAKCPVDWSIHMMANPKFSVPLNTRNDRQIRQQISSWSNHVNSWVSNPPFKVLVLRYEDMLANPLATFAEGMEFLNLAVSKANLSKAIEDASFDKLQRQEAQFGFREKPPGEGSFFRKGIVGDWKASLNEAQIHKIIQDHGEVMREYGYLNEVGCTNGR